MLYFPEISSTKETSPLLSKSASCKFLWCKQNANRFFPKISHEWTIAHSSVELSLSLWSLINQVFTVMLFSALLSYSHPELWQQHPISCIAQSSKTFHIPTENSMVKFITVITPLLVALSSWFTFLLPVIAKSHFGDKGLFGFKVAGRLLSIIVGKAWHHEYEASLAGREPTACNLSSKRKQKEWKMGIGYKTLKLSPVR